MKNFFRICCIIAATLTDCFAYTANDFLREMDEPGLCALTFDDGPSNYTPQLLDMMAREDVKATFFVLGQNAKRLPDVVRRELAEGHEVASHSWSHPNLRRTATEKIRHELLTTHDLLKTLGAEPRFFRPPYGNTTPYVESLAGELGMEIAIWSHDSLDWKRLPQNYAALAPVQQVGHRHGVFLFHDIHERTVNDFPRMVSQLRASGCRRFVTLSEYMRHVRWTRLCAVRAVHHCALCLATHPSARCRSSHAYAGTWAPLPARP